MVWTLTDKVHTCAGYAGHGPPLVRAHNWPWSSGSWRRLIPSLAQADPVLWCDMPGYRRSDMGRKRKTGLNIFGNLLAHWGQAPHALIAQWAVTEPRSLGHLPQRKDPATVQIHISKGHET